MKKISIIIGISYFILNAQIERWVYTYNGPGNNEDVASMLTLDDNKNLYVVGRSTASYLQDIFIVKLDTLGNVRDSYRYDGHNDRDFGSSIVYGEDGNIYVSGSNFQYYWPYCGVILKFDTLLNLQWVYERSGYGFRIIKGEMGKLYGTQAWGGWEAEGINVVKLDYSGNVDWDYVYNNTDAEIPYSIAYGLDGNIYVAGKDGFNSNVDNYLLVLKVNNQGGFEWCYLKTGLENWGWGYDIVYGQDNNVYVTGYVDDGTANGRDNLVVISLDTLGNERWVYKYDAAGYNDWGHSIVYGLDGNIYVVGTCYSSLLDNKITVISLDTEGNVRWIYNYEGPLKRNYGEKIIYTANHRLYIIGETRGITTQNYDIVVICLDTLGNERWVYQYEGEKTDDVTSILYAGNGDIYVTGSKGTYDTSDFLVIALKDTEVVNVKEDEKNKIPSIYPSKFFKDRIKLIGEINQPIEIILYNIFGERILSKTSSLVHSLILSDKRVKNLKNGIYFLKIKTKEQKETKKFKLIKF